MGLAKQQAPLTVSNMLKLHVVMSNEHLMPNHMLNALLIVRLNVTKMAKNGLSLMEKLFLSLVNKLESLENGPNVLQAVIAVTSELESDSINGENKTNKNVQKNNEHVLHGVSGANGESVKMLSPPEHESAR